MLQTLCARVYCARALQCLIGINQQDLCLQVLGFSDVTCLHIINEHIMPAFKSPAASALPHATLASHLAFIGSSGLLHTHSQDGQPDSAVGKQLLQNLRQHAVVVTPKRAVRVCEGTPLHFPLGMLQGGRHHPEPMAQLQGSQFDEPVSTKPVICKSVLCCSCAVCMPVQCSGRCWVA